jgi:hypothetical protein
MSPLEIGEQPNPVIDRIFLIAKTCDSTAGSGDRIRKAITKRCLTESVDLAGAFSACSAADGEALHECLDTAAAHEACLFLNEADALGANCD